MMILVALLVLALPYSPLQGSASLTKPQATLLQPRGSLEDSSALLEPIRKETDVPGLVCVVVKDGAVVAQGAVGVRKRGASEVITIDDRMHIGSCTKSMTATLCAILVEEGKLSWDLTVGRVFPELAASMDKAWMDVRLDQLLTNHSGAPEDLDAGGLWRKLWSHSGTPREQRLALVTGVVSRAPQAPPGTKHIYSNAGFSIAGAMAERVMDTPYEELLRQRLFTPLGMTSAGFGAPGVRGKIDQPRGHTGDGKAVEVGPGADNPVAIAPAGRVHCSLPDWARYVTAHLMGERDLDDGKTHILKGATFVKLHTPYSRKDGSYAMGWVATGRTGSRKLWHNGSNTMWYAETTIALDKGYAILVASNQGGDAGQKACTLATAALWAQLEKAEPADTK